jgi:hypothetical protein
MKEKNHPRKFCFIFLALLASLFTKAQNELLGSWSVSCPIEKMDERSGNACDLCPGIFDPKKKELNIRDFEMKFVEKTVFIKTENDLRTTFYSWDDFMRVLEFRYNDRRYVFKVLLMPNKEILVLKEAEGAIVIMVRKTGTTN